TYKKGTVRGPAAILEASRQVEFFDEWIEDEARRFGVRTLPPFEFGGPPEKLAPLLEEEIAGHLAAGRFPLILGGEHSLSLGPIRAAAREHPGLVVLHLDAHPDLRDEYEGTKFGHGCVMRRVLECGVRIHAFGIRSISPEERRFYARESRARAVLARELLALGPLRQVDRVLAGLPPGPLWLSFDLDGLDSGILPATGTPEPGGADWFLVSEILARLDREGREILGGDLVELLPLPGQHASEFLAARLAHRMLLVGLRSRERASGG
ncbi:MAG: agmatinase family protein, partial [Planctomycetota bacterium]